MGGPALTARDLELSGGRLHLREAGSGADALVLLHGLGSHGFTFRHLMEPLARAGWRVLAPDLPGAGLSSMDPGADHSLDGHCAAIERLLEASGIGRAVFLGHSRGAALAIRMRATRAARVRALVLVGGGFYRFRRPLSHRVLAAPLLGEAVGLLRGPRLVRLAAEDRGRAVGRLPEAWVESHFEPIRTWDGWRSLVATVRASAVPRAMREAESSFLAMPPCPLLVIWGERDSWIELPRARPFLEAQVERAAAAGFPAALVVLPDTGHAPQEERPRELAARVVEFLERLRSLATASESA